MKTSFEIGYAIDAGKKRINSPNQDAIGIVLSTMFRKCLPLIIVSDGMGGYNGGEIASKLTIKTISKYYRKFNRKTKKNIQLLVEGIAQAHQSIKKYARRNAKLQSMGCTVVAAILTEEQIYLANVGDSRAYLIQSDEIMQISFDHSKVADLVRAGLITELEARKHPKRNELSLSLTAKRETAPPFHTIQPWSQGNTLILCSDGLWGPVTESQILAVVSELEPQEAADKLVKLANTNRGPDNISVIIARNSNESTYIDQNMIETGEFDVKPN